MNLKNTTTSILLLFLVSCVNQVDWMVKNHPKKGTQHFYMFSALGGTHAAESSAGTRYSGNLEKSLADAFQAYVARGLSLDSTKVMLSKEVTSRHLAGQITLREANALKAQIAALESTNELTAFLASLPK